MKKTVAIIFGGQSSEHDISCISGRTVAGAIDAERYEVLLGRHSSHGEGRL